MEGLLLYSGLTAKLRAMESRLLREEEYRQLLELGSVGEVVSFLKQAPAYRDIFANVDENNIRRGEVESLLHDSTYACFMRIYRFAGQKPRAFLDLYFKRYEIHIIKKCLRLIFDKRQPGVNLGRFEAFFRKHSKVNWEKLTTARSLPELAASLQGSEYTSPLSHLREKTDATLFDYEMALDMYYFTRLWKYKQKVCRPKELESITRALGVKLDLLNLNWISRTKQFYNLSEAEVYAMLIPTHYKLSVSVIKQLVETANVQEFADVMSRTYYGKRYEELSPETLEDMYVSIVAGTLGQEARRHPYSTAMLYSYLYQKEQEVNRLTTALECIRYRLDPVAAYQLVMKQ